MPLRARNPGNNLKGNKIGGGSVPDWTDAQNNVARQLMMYYQLGGLSKAGAAALVGNQYQESGLNPSEQGGYLSQWLGSRLASLQSYARALGLPITSVEAQAKFTLHELRTSYPGLYAGLSKANDVTAAALAVSGQYERPAASAANNPRRVKNAQLAFTHIAGGPDNQLSSATGAGENLPSGGGSQPSSILDIFTSPIETIGPWIAGIAFHIVKDTAVAVGKDVIVPFWHWNQRAADAYAQGPLTDVTKDNGLFWNAAFWGLGYWLLFTDPDQKNLKPAPVRRSRLARRVRGGQALPARGSLIKPKHVAEKTPKKPNPVISRATVTQTGTMQTTRTQTVKVTGNSERREAGNQKRSENGTTVPNAPENERHSTRSESDAEHRTGDHSLQDRGRNPKRSQRPRGDSGN